MSFATRVLQAVCCAALLAACSGDPQREPSPEKRSSSPTPVEPVPAPADRACRGEVPLFPGSPPYRGAAPHKVIGFQLDDYDSSWVMRPNRPVLPDAWATGQGAIRPEVFPLVANRSNYEQAQLLLCMSAPRLNGTSPVGKCGPYSFGGWPGGGSTVPVLPTYYDFQVFEARTRTRVTSFRLDGSLRVCESSIFLNGRDLAQAIDDDALTAKLRPFVERDL